MIGPLARWLAAALWLLLMLPAHAAIDCTRKTSGTDYTGATLTTPQLARQDLRNASFRCATLYGATFIHSDLTGADFTGARFLPNPKPGGVSVSDFSFATLTGAVFANASFGAPTYFSYATLTSADFSNTDISTPNAIFGDEPLIFDSTATPSLSFAGARMSCEFIDQWAGLDLSSAILDACTAKMAGANFDKAVMRGVMLPNVVLDGASFRNADLRQATLTGASLQCLKSGDAADSSTRCVDMTNALLQGAHFENANLSGAVLYGALLSSDPPSILKAASFDHAHLKNVNLAAAHLAGASFVFANVYGDFKAPCNTDGDKNANGDGVKYGGPTKRCASAHAADFTGANLSNAYLYGIDLSNATLVGTAFNNAVLTAAGFDGATIDSLAGTGGPTYFTQAHLEGSNLQDAATLVADLTDAFVDVNGNTQSVQLDGGAHNNFSGCSKPACGQDVCVQVIYSAHPLPLSNPGIVCPNGLPAGPAGCQASNNGVPPWQSRLDASSPGSSGAPPPAWYQSPPSGNPGVPKVPQVCHGFAPVFLW